MSTPIPKKSRRNPERSAKMSAIGLTPPAVHMSPSGLKTTAMLEHFSGVKKRGQPQIFNRPALAPDVARLTVASVKRLIIKRICRPYQEVR